MDDYYENFPMSENVKASRDMAHQLAVQYRNRYVEPIQLIYAMYNRNCVCSEILHS